MNKVNKILVLLLLIVYSSIISFAAVAAVNEMDNKMELLQNPGFEIQDPKNPAKPYKWSSWQSGNNAIFTYETSMDGGSSVAIEYQTVNKKDAVNGGGWGQNYVIDITKKYKLSGWIKTENVTIIYGDPNASILPSQPGASITIMWTDNDYKFITETFIVPSRQRDLPDWTYFEKVVTPDPRSYYGHVLADFKKCTGKVWFDNISLTEVEDFNIDTSSNNNTVLNEGFNSTNNKDIVEEEHIVPVEKTPGFDIIMSIIIIICTMYIFGRKI